MGLAICGPSDVFWYTKRFLSDSNIIITLFRVVTKMSSGQVNTTRRRGINQGFLLVPFFFFFPLKVA